MAAPTLTLPINVPWKLVAVSPDMMDTQLGNKRFPAAWRSSLAISVYEPKADELPPELCDERVTYVKVTSSITGYQPTAEDIERAFVEFPSVPGDVIVDVLEQDSYLACYGALLNVAVFPLPRSPHLPGRSWGLDDYPHVIAMEPKSRDLYQAATEAGEVLTASASKIATDKTLVHTESSETGLSITGGLVPGTAGGGQLVGGLTHKWGETDQDSNSVQTDASRERRESQGTTTQISQMYNLLTGYHQGTNRAAFLLLPRPHTLQATDRRTFVQGLRYIEGIQEWVLVVSRPSKVSGICIETFLETGHFPEDVEIDYPDAAYEETDEQMVVRVSERWTTKEFEAIRTPPAGYIVDRRKGDPEHRGLTLVADDSNEFAKNTRQVSYDITDVAARVFGTVKGVLGLEAKLDMTFTVHYRSEQPRPSDAQASVSLDELMVTRRGLKVCIRSGKECPDVVEPDGPTLPGDDPEVYVESIVDERPLGLNSALASPVAVAESRLPAMTAVVRQIQRALVGASALPTRYPAGVVDFVDTDYFTRRVLGTLPDPEVQKLVSEIENLPKNVRESLGITPVGEVLEMNLATLARKTGLDISEAADIRARLIGRVKTVKRRQPPPESEEGQPSSDAEEAPSREFDEEQLSPEDG